MQINNQPNLINLTQKIKKVPLKHFEFKWTKSSPNFSIEVPLNQEYPVNEYTKTPLEYFLNFFSDDIFNLIVLNKQIYIHFKSLINQFVFHLEK